MADPSDIKSALQALSAEAGFVAWGISRVGPSPDAEAYRRWLDLNYRGSMDYLARHADARVDLGLEFPWARSVVSLAMSYAPAQDQQSPHIARYARGRDYHKVLKQRGRRICDDLRRRFGPMRTRVCVDTAPVAERAWAVEAGIGWLGDNGCVIHPTFGSYLLLAEILLEVELPPDSPVAGRCEGCGACMRACPNGAIVEAGLVDARRCISYLTIEHRGPIDADRLNLAGWLFGCDCCQQVCPYNQPGRCPPGDAELRGPSPLAAATPEAVLAWSEAEWDAATRGSAGRRAKLAQWHRNAALVCGQTGRRDCRAALAALAQSAEPLAAEAATWALERLDP